MTDLQEALSSVTDIDEVSLYRVELSEGHSWRKRGVTHVEVLEYSELGDDNDTRTIRVSAPAGQWTVGGLVDALLVMQNTLRTRSGIANEQDQ